MNEIHLISRQVGTAYPFVEFSQFLTANGFKVKNFAYASSFAPYQAGGVPYEIVTSFDDYIKLAGQVPRVLMTGTSLEVTDDAKYWNYAKDNRISSIAWVDQPINLKERFTAGKPSVVLANDQHTLAHLIEIGIVEDARCYGSPYLSSMSKRIQRESVEKNAIFFASEPYFENRSDYLIRAKSPNRLKFGFDDIDSLLLATELINKQTQLTGEALKIFVRPHPCDNTSRLMEAYLTAGGKKTDFEFTNLDKEQILERVPVVFGMRSMFLFEAASLGIPTVSLQPGSRVSWPFMDSHKGILRLTGANGDFERLSDLLGNLKDRQVEVLFDEPAVLKLFVSLGNFRANEIRLHG